MPSDPNSKERTLQLLVEARALIEKGWTYNASARDKNGHEIPPKSPYAVRFCAQGALIRAKKNLFGRGIYNDRCWVTLNDVARKEFSATNVVELNDQTKSKKKILALYDKAIEQVKAAIL